jgi:hypothetical protein
MTDAEVKAKLTIEQEGEPQSLRDAADAVGALATAAEAAGPALEALKTAAAGLETALQTVATGLQNLESAGASAFGPLLAQLDQVITKANAAAAALAQVTSE